MPETLRVWLIEDHKTYGERLSRALNRIAGIDRFRPDVVTGTKQEDLPRKIEKRHSKRCRNAGQLQFQRLK
jgi:hypothetical protein